jgi:ABC-type molybdate transport system ATPase subunit
MITASIRLTGTLNDGAEVYRSYYLVADFGSSGSGKASIIPMSIGAPMPDDDHLAVKYGGEEAALKAAAEAIKALPGNVGLEVKAVVNPE